MQHLLLPWRRPQLLAAHAKLKRSSNLSFPAATAAAAASYDDVIRNSCAYKLQVHANGAGAAASATAATDNNINSTEKLRCRVRVRVGGGGTKIITLQLQHAAVALCGSNAKLIAST